MMAPRGIRKMPEPLFELDPPKERICLRCRKKFRSRGDRLCGKCNDANRGEVHEFPCSFSTAQLGEDF